MGRSVTVPFPSHKPSFSKGSFMDTQPWKTQDDFRDSPQSEDGENLQHHQSSGAIMSGDSEGGALLSLTPRLIAPVPRPIHEKGRKIGL